MPSFGVDDVDVVVPDDHLTIKIKGNLVAQLADLFKFIFKGVIRDVIISSIKD